MSNRIVIPLVRTGCCSSSFRADYYPALAAYCTPEEFAASIGRINQSFRGSAGLLIGAIVSGIVYVLGLLGMLTAGDRYGTSSLPSYGVSIGAFVVGLVGLSYFSVKRKRARTENLTAAVVQEHVLYSHRQPQLAWRVSNSSYYFCPVLEVDLLGGIQTAPVAVPMPSVPTHGVQVYHATPSYGQPIYAQAAPPAPHGYAYPQQPQQSAPAASYSNAGSSAPAYSNASSSASPAYSNAPSSPSHSHSVQYAASPYYGGEPLAYQVPRQQLNQPLAQPQQTQSQY